MAIDRQNNLNERKNMTIDIIIKKDDEWPHGDIFIPQTQKGEDFAKKELALVDGKYSGYYGIHAKMGDQDIEWDDQTEAEANHE